MADYVYTDGYEGKEEQTAMDYTKFSGWDNTRHPIADYADNNVFLGVPNVTQNTLAFMEPFIGGYGRVFCIMAPIFFPLELRLSLMRVIERFCKGLSGLSNYELTTVEITYGNNAEPMTVPVGIKKGNNTFTLRFTELRGSLIRKLIKYWITGIADLGSGYGTYHGRVFTEGLRFSAVNHTAVILYSLTDNSGGAYGLDSIEFACMWFGAFPNSINNSHFDYTQGEKANADLDVPLFGIFHENNTINTFAAEMLKKSNFYRDNYHDFNMGDIVHEAFQARMDSEGAYYNFEPLQKDANQFNDEVSFETGLMTADKVGPMDGGPDGATFPDQ